MHLERQVSKITSELFSYSHAQTKFRENTNGVVFEDHAHTRDGPDPNEHYSFVRGIHRDAVDVETLVTVAEYVPAHRLRTDHLSLGLQSMDFLRDDVQVNAISVENNSNYKQQRDNGFDEKLIDDATLLVAAALVHRFDSMIREGLEYSYITTGLAIIQLWIPFDDPGTLYYHWILPLDRA